MEFHVLYREGDDPAMHWKEQVTLPRQWLTSSCDRLKSFLVRAYNEEHPEAPQLQADAVHLCNEGIDRREALGSENLVSEVVGPFSQIFIRAGQSIERTTWRCEDHAPEVHVHLDFDSLLALRKAVEADDTEALQRAVEVAGVASPHDLLTAERDVLDQAQRPAGTEWHSVAGRFAWDTDAEGGGADPGAKVSLAGYCHRRCAERCLKLIEVSDHCAAPILGSARRRSPEAIEASANGMAGKMTEMESQMRASQVRGGGT